MYGGSVIAVAVPRRASVAIHSAPGLRLVAVDAGLDLRVESRDDLRLVPPPNAAAAIRMTPAELSSARRSTYLNVLKAVVAAQGIENEGIEIRCWSEVPPNAGLSSSSALLVAALYASNAWLGRQAPLHRFAESAREIEFSRMGVTCGFQDFYATSFGGLTYMDFRDKEHWRGPDVDPLATVEPLLESEASLPLVLAHTGRQRDSGETHRPLRARWVEGDRQVREVMQALGTIAREAKRHVMVGDWPAVGMAMNVAHRHIASVGGSGPVVDALIEKSIKLGARGAKLAGAGLGGTIIAMHEDPAWLADAVVKHGAASAFAVRQAAPGVRFESTEVAADARQGIRTPR
jgi:galactokinase/mevalonate kinase-like predicted kinase